MEEEVVVYIHHGAAVACGVHKRNIWRTLLDTQMIAFWSLQLSRIMSVYIDKIGEE
jgi:hypothetical protein